MKANHRPNNLATRFYDNVSFAGCGALNFYQTGVGFGIQQSGVDSHFRYCGASAGAGLAFTMAAGLDAREVCTTMASWICGFGPGRVLRPAWAFTIANRFGEHFATSKNFQNAKGRFGISVTQQRPLRNQVVESFKNVQDLRSALIASCFIPYPGQLSVDFRARRSMDGGFTNNQPNLSGTTLKVSPFWFDVRAHIRPDSGVAISQALRVPTEPECWSLFNRGFTDYRRWMNQEESSHPLARLRRVSERRRAA